MPHHIVYMSHGGDKYHEQTRFSVLTLLNLLRKEQRNDVRIIVYTDRPAACLKHEWIEPRAVSRKELTRYQGPLGAIHRVKLEILKRAEAEFGFPLVYIDGDTQWTKWPAERFDGLTREQRQRACSTGASERPPFLMHAFECHLSESCLPADFEMLKSQRHKLLQWGLPTEPPWTMWNAGVVGIPWDGAGLLERMLEIHDYLLPYSGKSVLTEQLSVSLVASNCCRLQLLDDSLSHYWRYRSELPYLLRRHFEMAPSAATVEDLARHSETFSINPQEVQEVRRSKAYRWQTWCDKRKRKLLRCQHHLGAFWRRLHARREAALDHPTRKAA